MQKLKLTGIIILLGTLLAACGGNQGPTPTPTLSVSDVQTMAVSTYADSLTQTAAAMPTNTPTDTPTPATPASGIVPFNTFVPLTGSGTPIAVLSSPTTSCYGLLFVNDVSIPDDTKMDPGKKFTKTWLIQNTGGCAWQAGFKWTLTGGNPMGGSTVTLTQPVNPSAQYQISVPMIAPTTPGEATGTWRMQDANGNFFGQAVWVKIMVANTSVTDTPGATDTPAATDTPTATP